MVNLISIGFSLNPMGEDPIGYFPEVDMILANKLLF